MQKAESFIEEDLYLNHLTIIREIPFTRREIDVMACLLGGRRTSKIACFLSIDPRTVETHIRNITLKLACNTREGIIDFLEGSDKLPVLRRHYFSLQIEAAFEKSLKDIAKLIRGENLICYLINGNEPQPNSPLSLSFKKHLKLAGVVLQSKIDAQEKGYFIYILSPSLQGALSSCDEIISHSQKDKVLLLLTEGQKKKDLPKELKEFECISFETHQNYYFCFFTIIKKIFLNIKIDNFISTFKEKYQKLHDVMQSEHAQVLPQNILRRMDSITQTSKWPLLIAFIICGGLIYKALDALIFLKILLILQGFNQN